jgi:hypothetical protein
MICLHRRPKPGLCNFDHVRERPLAFFRLSSWRSSAAAIWSHILLSSSRRDRCTGLPAPFANWAHCAAFLMKPNIRHSGFEDYRVGLGCALLNALTAGRRSFYPRLRTQSFSCCRIQARGATMVQAPRPKAISALVLSMSSKTPRTRFSPKNTTTTGSPFCNVISPEEIAPQLSKQNLKRSAVQFRTLLASALPGR